MNESIREKMGLDKEGLVFCAMMSGGSLIVASKVPSRYRCLRKLFGGS